MKSVIFSILVSVCQQGQTDSLQEARNVERMPHIILVTLDTLRADHLGCYGYFRNTSPNLDQLAEVSIVYRRAYVPMATTFPTHLSIMTGLHPIEHGFLSNTRLIDARFEPNDEVRTVAQMLVELGYQTAAFVSAAPVRDTTGLDAGFNIYDQPKEEDWKLDGQRDARQTIDRVLRAMPHLVNTRKPLFIWVHLFDAHWPYTPPAPFAPSKETKSLLDKLKITTEFPAKWKELTAEQIFDAYDGEIRFLDAQLGRLFKELKARGVWNDAVTVVTSDHGEGLGQHNWAAHGQIYQEQLHAPLIVHIPGERAVAQQIERPVSLTHLFHEICGHVGPLKPLASRLSRRVEFECEGETAIVSQRADKKDAWEPGQRFAMSTSRWRYYYMPESKDQLFDLDNDPYELRNLILKEPEIASRLKRCLIEAITTLQDNANRIRKNGGIRAPIRAADPDMADPLRSLGYIDDEP